MSQLVTPHPIWVDQMPWPKLRDHVIHHQAIYATDEYQELFTASLSVNWPYDPFDALVFRPDEVTMAPLFEEHIYRLENWSLGPWFAQRYPELKPYCKFAIPADQQGMA